MRDVFLNLVDLCQARVESAKLQLLNRSKEQTEIELNEVPKNKTTELPIKEESSPSSLSNRNHKSEQVKQADYFNHSDTLLRDYYDLLNKVLGFGVVSFYKDFGILTQLAKFSLSSIQLNSVNPQLTYILECSRDISEEEINKRLLSWRLPKLSDKFTNQSRVTKAVGFREVHLEDDLGRTWFESRFRFQLGG